MAVFEATTIVGNSKPYEIPFQNKPYVRECDDNYVKLKIKCILNKNTVVLDYMNQTQQNAYVSLKAIMQAIEINLFVKTNKAIFKLPNNFWGVPDVSWPFIIRKRKKKTVDNILIQVHPGAYLIDFYELDTLIVMEQKSVGDALAVCNICQSKVSIFVSSGKLDFCSRCVNENVVMSDDCSINVKGKTFIYKESKCAVVEKSPNEVHTNVQRCCRTMDCYQIHLYSDYFTI